jgi:hypothetical protein
MIPTGLTGIRRLVKVPRSTRMGLGMTLHPKNLFYRCKSQRIWTQAKPADPASVDIYQDQLSRSCQNVVYSTRTGPLLISTTTIVVTCAFYLEV